MTWTDLPNLVHAQQVNESHMDQIRQNIEHLGAMKFGGTLLSALTAANAACSKLGTYTGDGAANKSITGVGFEPNFLIVITHSAGNIWFKTAGMGANSQSRGFAGYYGADMLISFNADGFGIGDGTGMDNPNTNGTVYSYIALRL